MDTLTKSRLSGIEARLEEMERFKAQLLASAAAPFADGARNTHATPAPVAAESENIVSVSVGAFDVDAFCAAHNISRSKLYQLWSDRTGPSWMQVGHRRLISHEAAARWRRERELAARAVAG